MLEQNKWSIDNQEIKLSINDKIESWENTILNNIAKEFWLHKSNLEKLTTFKTSNWIKWLREEISTNNIENLKEVPDNKLEELLDWIKNYQQRIKEESINKLSSLKKDTNQLYKREENTYIFSKLSKELKDKYINNPISLSDNIIWWTIWIASTSEKIIKTTYEIWKWIIMSPIDIYNLATKRAKYDKNI